jgi:S-adenosylmethionine uptake transporter
VALATVIGIGVFSGIMMIGTEWHPVIASSWLLVLGASVAVLSGTFLSVMAMQTGEISFVSTFRYTSMIGAIGVGVLIFDDWPDQLTLVGTVIIVITGVYTFYREQTRNRKVTN